MYTPRIPPVIHDDGKKSLIKFETGDICVDIEACKSEKRLRFTLAHEAGHSQFDLFVAGNVLYQKKNIFDTHGNLNIQSEDVKSDFGWTEYHANMYASYILMPSVFVRKLFKIHYEEIFRKNHKRISFKEPKRMWAFIAKIAGDLNVSNQAIAVRLRQLSLISKNVYKSLQIKNE